MPGRDESEQYSEQPRRRPRASREDEFVTANRPGSTGPRRDRTESDAPPPKKKNNTLLLVLLGIGGFALLTLCICCGVGGYFGYEFQRANTEMRRTSNDLKQIGLAMHNHHDAVGYFPHDYTTQDGKPLLSWRVALLPYIEQDNLFRKFKLNEPWDSPNNRALLNQCPKTYLSRRHKDPTLTCYQGFAGPGTVFDPKVPRLTFTMVPDGLTNTIFAVEAEDAVPWTKPVDLPFSDKGPLPKLHYRSDIALALICDGSVRQLNSTMREQTMRYLIMRADGNVIPNE